MAHKMKSSKAEGKQAQNLYLCQFSYTAQAWQHMLANDKTRDRIKGVEKLVEKLGGCFPQITIDCSSCQPQPREKFGSFGDHDVVVLLAFPNDTKAAAFAMAIAAGGAVTAFKTTRLMPWPQMMDAMQAAAGAVKAVQYLAPRS